ncbi:MAG: hypothetical protein LBH05_05475 [Deferribacteraceae bacterium]|jgi:cell division transport system permease protein|nr:hypothetical protein [Deferribacteraceae bacterium]
MTAKFLFVSARGIKLFLNYFKNSLMSVIALSALFLILHTAFSIGGGISRFTDSVARFDTVRIYPAEKADLQTLAKSAGDVSGVEAVTVYSGKETKEYIKQNAPAIDGIEPLPDDIFPSFLEILAAKDHQNAQSLESMSKQFREMNGVESVSYGQEWAKRLSDGKRAINAILFAAAIIFSAAGILIVYQTVSVTMNKYTEEIQVYSIVGGTEVFITMPFIVFALCIGASCVLLSLSCYKILYMTLLLSIENAAGLTLSLSWSYCLIFTVAAPTVTIISGFISANSFLRSCRWQ